MPTVSTEQGDIRGRVHGNHVHRIPEPMSSFSQGHAHGSQLPDWCRTSTRFGRTHHGDTVTRRWVGPSSSGGIACA